MSPVLSELLEYLHNQDLYLPPGFNENLIPMLLGRARTTTREYTFQRSEDGVQRNAKWISVGYGYAVRIVITPDGEEIEVLTDIFKTKWIALDQNGFFNNKPTDLIFKLPKGVTYLPFSSDDFAALTLKVPEAQLLATKILSAQHAEDEKIKAMLRMKGETKKLAFEKIFGMEVYQYFDRKDIARYLGFTPEHFSRM